jgi:hypothetical protein
MAAASSGFIPSGSCHEIPIVGFEQTPSEIIVPLSTVRLSNAGGVT